MAWALHSAHDDAVTAVITRRRLPSWSWLTWLLAIGLASAAVASDWRQLMPGSGDTAANLAANLAVAAGYPLAGAIILTHRPRHRIGILLCAVGLASAVALFTHQYATRAVILAPGSLPFAHLAAWLSSWSWALGVIPALTLLPLLFPDGNLPSPRWWPVPAAGLGATGLAAIGHGLAPGPLSDFPSIRNPLGISALGSASALMRAFVLPVFLLTMIAGGTAMALRWRRGDALVRRQIGWLLLATAVLVAVVVADSFHVMPRQVSSFVVFIAMLLLPAAIVVAVLRYRLYDIDVVVNRSLVYGGLTGGLIGIYVAIVTVVGRLAGQLSGSVVAAAAVAVAFQPFRQRVQGGVDRLMYGDRREPYQALSRLGSRLGQASSPAALLPVVAEGVSEALRVPGTRIELVSGERVLASATHGTVDNEAEADADTFPVLYQDHLVGRMIIARRAPGQPLSGPDRRLLADLGAQATAAIEDVRRLVHGLRPPSLDDLGLLGAVREQANRLSVPSRGLVVCVDAPDRLPALPAAVEVAAYRIVAEALTNVSRHAKAAHCAVQIRTTDTLDVVIEDDGVGIGTINGHGLGLSSMAERAAELGGICLVEPVTPSGTRIVARLPMSPP